MDGQIDSISIADMMTRNKISQLLMLRTKLILESKLICTYFQSNSTPRAPNHNGSILHMKTQHEI